MPKNLITLTIDLHYKLPDLAPASRSEGLELKSLAQRLAVMTEEFSWFSLIPLVKFEIVP